jgi:aquaporin Z
MLQLLPQLRICRKLSGNCSSNPARSTGPALFVGGWALAQLWMFWVAPLIGGVLGGVIYRWLSEEPTGTVAGR